MSGHLRVVGSVCLVAALAASCGGDNKKSEPPTTIAAASSPTSPAPATSATASSAAGTPTSAPSPEIQQATQALLTAADLPPGWNVHPRPISDSGSSQFAAPECAALKAVNDQPGMKNEAAVIMLAPDGFSQVTEQVTVTDAAVVKQAYDAFAADSTPACLQASLTAEFSQPGRLPQGAQFGGVQLQRQPAPGGEEAVNFAGQMVLNAPASQQTIPLQLEAIRSGRGLALLTIISAPGAQPVDGNGLAAAAGKRLAAVPAS
jgi:hypothetical protein